VEYARSDNRIDDLRHMLRWLRGLRHGISRARRECAADGDILGATRADVEEALAEGKRDVGGRAGVGGRAEADGQALDGGHA
jgi:hypothetical protein